MALDTAYKIVISPAVLFKNGSTLGDPAVEIPFTTVASVPDITLTGAVLSGQTLTLTGLPAGADLEYRVVTGSTAGDWAALSYSGTAAAIDAGALNITSGVSRVEVRVKGGMGATAAKTVYLAVDGNQAEMKNGVALCFEDKVTVTPENLNQAGTNRASLRRYTLPSDMKYHIDPVGFAYEVYLQGAGDGKKVTLTFPVDPGLNIDQMSVYTLDKSDDTTADKSNPRAWRLNYLTPDRSRADQYLISVDATDVPEAGGTFVYQVFLDNVNPGPVGFTATPIIESDRIIFPQIQCYDNDFIAYVEVYRDGKMVGLVDGTNGFGSASFTDADPALQVGQTYAYNLKAYDRMGNYAWSDFGDRMVRFEPDAMVLAKIRQQIEDGTISLTYAPGDSADHVVTDIKLPWTVDWAPDARIWWTSSEPDVITCFAGLAVVMKPEDGSDKEVTLTALVKLGDRTNNVTVTKKLRVTWEPWTGGVMPVHNAGTVNSVKDTSYEFKIALDKDNIQTIVLEGGLSEDYFLKGILDLRGKTLVAPGCIFQSANNDGYSLTVKNGVIDLKGASKPEDITGYSAVARNGKQGGLIFDNVEFKGGENQDSFIWSRGGSLVVTNCRFGSTKVAPIIVSQPDTGISEPSGVRIESSTFDGAGRPGYAVLYEKDGTLTAVNNTITGFQGTMTDGGPSAGFMITPGQTATLVGNQISNCDNGILVQTRSSANTTINGFKISNAASATTAGNALLENNELTAGSGPVVVINNVDGLFHPVVWYQAASDNLTAFWGAPAWAADKTLTASDINETELILSWTGASDLAGVTGYRVYNGANLVATVSDSSCRVNNLMPDKTYQFRVEAGNAQGKWSLDGPVTTAVTLANTPPVWPEGSQVSVTEAGSNSIILSWTPATDKEGIRNYHVYINGQASAAWTKPENRCYEVQSYGDNRLQPDTEYTFQIYAEDSLKMRSPGPSVTARTAANSDNKWPLGKSLTVSNLQSNSLTLNLRHPNLLDKPSGLGNDYLYKLVANGEEMATYPFTDSYLPNSTGSDVLNVTGLQPGTTYTFKLDVSAAKYNWETTDGPSITLTTPALGSQNCRVGQPVDLYLQGSAGWMNSIKDVQLGGNVSIDGTSVFKHCTVTPGHIRIGAGAFTEAKNYVILIRSDGYPDVYVIQTMLPGTPVVDPPAVSGQYTLAPADDAAYTKDKTASGIDTMTVKSGVSGLQFFTVNINPVIAHEGNEKVVFVLMRGGVQINLNATGADFDSVHSATAGFNVQAGDVIKVYIVDDLTNAIDFNPNILQ
ncbi:MAG: fibronectin type III domain-containing protein [Desulfotomaculaceae bacterium]|nr:fibronectin type III domain-containing protein [Desulfotomaculaceae bacterium]